MLALALCAIVIVLLPVVLFILGFDLVTLMAITAWSRTAWVVALVAVVAVTIGYLALRAVRQRV
jgi:hypothetical protein